MPFNNNRNSRDDKSKKEGSKFGKPSSHRTTGANTSSSNKSNTGKHPYGTYNPGANADDDKMGFKSNSEFKNKHHKKSNDEAKPYSRNSKSGPDRNYTNYKEKNTDNEKPKSRPRKAFVADDKQGYEDKNFANHKPREAKSYSHKKFIDRDKKPFKGKVKAEEDDLRPSYSSKVPNFSRPYEKIYEKRGQVPNQNVIDFGDGNFKQKNRNGNKNGFNKDAAFIRLNRFIANAGICSRRKADELIAAGVVSVNGEVVTELGTKVNPNNDQIRYNGELLKSEKMVYVLLNKPKDFITTTEDPHERKTVMALVDKASHERIYPVGRLDRNTTGLLLMTNDGDLAEKLSHPRNNISKIYQVELNRNLSQGDFNKITFGLELEDGFIKPDALSYVTGGSKNELGIQIHSGKNRIVRRIFEFLGYEVVKLDRVIYANLSKKDLPRGKWRHLNEKEIIQLKHFIK
ncbi:MAG: rRNA pseudouridine synthase [Sphingobacteriales bacterium]|nr:MAG: rRNA pseudouridine synthase [Sphingobacteriales bacterium]TAF79343.1 MAG: rRNA pseudouridine synthase [Sphingobacteriales bacterium]